MFYYILTFFSVFYHVCLSNCLEICFRSIPRWIALGAALESPLSGPAKRVAAFLVDGGEGHRQQNDGEGQIQGGKCPLILFVVGCLIFFFPAPFVGAQMVLSENILTLGLYVRVWQAWISGFAGAPERGWFSYNQCLGWIMRGPVPIVVTVWSSGGEFPRFESQDASLRPLKSLCLIVWLFVYLCCQVLNTIHLPWLIKPPSQQHLAQDQHFLKLATSCQSATFG